MPSVPAQATTAEKRADAGDQQPKRFPYDDGWLVAELLIRKMPLDAGLPGDRTTVLLLYLAGSGFMVEDLTLPDFLAPYGLDELLHALVERTLPTSAEVC